MFLYDNLNEEYQEKIKGTTMYFNNMACALLFYWQELGQISDGKYESSRPIDHYRWLPDKDGIIVDENIPDQELNSIRVYRKNTSWNAMDRPKTYNIRDLLRNEYVFDDIYNTGRFGRALNNNTTEVFQKFCLYEMRIFVEQLPFDKPYETVEEYFEFWKTKANHYSKYIEKIQGIFTQRVYDSFYQQEYSIKDLKNDLAKMDITVNTFKTKSWYDCV